jgi:hypothetical protein
VSTLQPVATFQNRGALETEGRLLSFDTLAAIRMARSLARASGIGRRPAKFGRPGTTDAKKAAGHRLPTAAFPKLKRYCDGLTTVGFTVCCVVVVLLFVVEVVVVFPFPEA